MHTAKSLVTSLIRKSNGISANDLLKHGQAHARPLKNHATGKRTAIDLTIPLTRKVNPSSGHDIIKHDQALAKARKDGVTGNNVDPWVVINHPMVAHSLTRKFPTSGHNILKHDQARAHALKNPFPRKSFRPNGGRNILEHDQARSQAIQKSLFGGRGVPGVFRLLIGSALAIDGFDYVEGNLSIGPVDLIIGSETALSVATEAEKLFKQGAMPASQIAVSFRPTTRESDVIGEVTWGGTDSSKFTGSITFTPTTKTSPANKYWGIDQSIRYGASTNILSLTAGIVDIGTTLILIATDAFMEYKSATGAVPDEKTGLLRINPENYANLQSLFFTINGVTVELTKNAQTWPRYLNTVIGGEVDDIYLVMNDIGSRSGEGLDFINGYAFLERFYSAFDVFDRQVGFAPTAFTYATSN